MGICIMKTKIIYISGSEVFDIADIRAAFDEVRAALALDKETVLFGVPVDSDSALTNVTQNDNPDDTIDDIPGYVFDDAGNTIISPEFATLQQPEAKETPVVLEPAAEEEPAEKPKKTIRRTRAKVVPIKPESDITPEPMPETIPDEKPAIPILSVLGAKSETPIVEPEPIIVTPIDVAPLGTNNKPIGDNSDNDTQHVSISDMLADDSAPVDTHEKTLEELLESMTPLGEDEKIVQKPISESVPETEPIQIQDDDTDATLELLATEFAESADKIVAPSKTETRGKIGKLKNILPFKKAKRDDSGIMGDLFGWAGVANDEDFTIPGFFANASSKK